MIEGEPYVSTVSVEPGMTNQVLENPKSKIKGSNTENMETKEGAIRFDIIFMFELKDGNFSDYCEYRSSKELVRRVIL